MGEKMVLKRFQKFIEELDNRRLKKEGGKGTIWISMEEFEKVAEYFKGQLVSPGGAANMLHVSRAMIHQLERDGKVRAYRVVVADEFWDRLDFYLRLMVKRKSAYIYIPVEDIRKYGESVGRVVKE